MFGVALFRRQPEEWDMARAPAGAPPVRLPFRRWCEEQLVGAQKICSAHNSLEGQFSIQSHSIVAKNPSKIPDPALGACFRVEVELLSREKN